MDLRDRSTGEMAYHAGLAAEDSVASDYCRRGYTIAETRWRGCAGEIDLIVADGSSLIFVEVKKSRSFSRAAQRITARQMGRIYAAAEEYLGKTPAGALTECRFDVALLDAHGQCRVIENAFGHG
ncbi:YraN family protein [Sulfitobacter sp. S190]|uniref:YraN family protein n=1 Tax=Sulfitobacter sp. S190 TaxID=2867022 RepID=UPI0021A8639D|nr:YraN family protein [Sulfitobacter sp. S190]UWR22099.1 YraN family protein [Sulfitobacter sp. S190]